MTDTTTTETIAEYPTPEKLAELGDLAFSVHNDLDVIRQRLSHALDELNPDTATLDFELFGQILHHGRTIKAQAESMTEQVDRIFAAADSLVQETVIEPAWQAQQARRAGGETP